MTTIITLSFGLLHSALLVAAWIAAHRLSTPAPSYAPPESWPPVRIVLPFAGATATITSSFDDLAAQDYPSFEICLSCDAGDAAALAAAQDWIRRTSVHGGPPVQLIRAQLMPGCSRKNQNLLAGLGPADNPDLVMVFTDAGYRRTPDWLKHLVAPIAVTGCEVSSGYYFAEAGAGWHTTLRPITAMLLFLTRQYKALRQTWGGATAITRRLFDELNMADVWSTHIVDDVALAERLRHADIPVAGINVPALQAPAIDSSVFKWSNWFIRQLAYVRFTQPDIWAGIGVVLLLLSAGLFWMTRLLFCAHAAPWLTALAVLDGLLLTALGLRLHALHPRPGPRGPWLGAFFFFMLFAPCCHFRTAFSRTICWRGVCYRVGRHGRVLSTSAKPATPPDTRPE